MSIDTPRRLIEAAQKQLADAKVKLDLAAALMDSPEGSTEVPLVGARGENDLVPGGVGAHTVFGDFRLSGRSLKRLDGVHPDMIAVVEYAIRVTSVDFGITRTGGVRTREMQRKLVDAGKSGTMRSRHRTGHAVDVAPLDPKTGKYTGEPRHAVTIHVAFELASDALDVPLRWGGDWNGDGEWRQPGENDLVHHELPRSDYGDNKSSQSEKAAAFLASIAAGGFA